MQVLMPSEASEANYGEVLDFMNALVTKCMGSEVYPHGSFALKT